MSKKPNKTMKPPVPIEDERSLKIAEAVSNLAADDLMSFGAWQSLDELSSNTIFDGIEANPDGIFETEDHKFQAIADVYVTLQYGGKKDGTSMSDAYPAKVSGTIDAGEVKIEAIDVDTSSFYR
jgi:hypothetical protein